MKHRNVTLVLSAIAMMILILDSKTASLAAFQGLVLCIQTIIPALFPFFVLSSLLTSSLSGKDSRLFAPLEHLLRIPAGSGSIFLTGVLGGYPVGARCIREAYDHKQLSQKDARRMLSFCSNAGPSFLFGMIAPFFPDRKFAWILWGIHILSAVITALLIPGKPDRGVFRHEEDTITLPRALESAIRTTAMVCGWVILFRLILSFLGRWFFWAIPSEIRILLTGLTELSNGCILLGEVSGLADRFLLASTMLGFGGFCVSMQTKSILGALPFESYLRGKFLQTLVSFLLSMDYLCLFLPADFTVSIPMLISAHLLLLGGWLIFATRKKKLVAIPL